MGPNTAGNAQRLSEEGMLELTKLVNHDDVSRDILALIEVGDGLEAPRRACELFEMASESLWLLSGLQVQKRSSTAKLWNLCGVW